MRSTHQGRAISLLRSERGITGLETAIILIAFIVVASVLPTRFLPPECSLLRRATRP